MARVAKGQITLTKVTNGDTISVSIKGVEVDGFGFEPSAAYDIPLTPPFIETDIVSPLVTLVKVI